MDGRDVFNVVRFVHHHRHMVRETGRHIEKKERQQIIRTVTPHERHLH
jgi:hypothetical protein